MNHLQRKIDSQEILIQESLGPGKLEGTIKKQLGAFILVILVERKFNQIPVVQLNKRHHPLQAISQHNNGQQLLDNSNTTTRLHQRIKPNTLIHITHPHIQTNHQQVKAQLRSCNSHHQWILLSQDHHYQKVKDSLQNIRQDRICRTFNKTATSTLTSIRTRLGRLLTLLMVRPS